MAVVERRCLGELRPREKTRKRVAATITARNTAVLSTIIRASGLSSLRPSGPTIAST